ncbi:hypothetical protein ACFCYC_23400, partial [Streptomyces sp. NPDC056402]|uniref:hypothetical protein n=1 Tax=Streptomyces sp. NPDC056402 TaxID=3345810 RepID=UPI0035D727F4
GDEGAVQRLLLHGDAPAPSPHHLPLAGRARRLRGCRVASGRAATPWHARFPRCRRSTTLRVASLLRLAIHGALRRSLIRPDRQDTP